MTQEEALEILKTGANVFLTGEPGSGKTYTVNQYVDYLKKHSIQPAITASTGIAATHLGGLTIHSWSGIGIKENLTRGDLEKIVDNSRVAKRVKNASVLIIDEISMLGAGIFGLIDLVCKEIRQSREPFGGLQVVVAGDFFQLPPVSKDTKTPQFAFQSPIWEKTNFAVCYLTQQFRQDDPDFLTMLSSIRSNSFSDSHLQSIKTRLIELEHSPRNITRIFSHNIDVDRINQLELSQLPGETKVFQMFARGQRNFVDSLKRGCLSPEALELKTDACVMFTKNNVKDGFMNGTIGRVVDFDQETNYPIVKTSENKQIEVLPVEWSIEENGRIKARITQIPLRLAWAITVHKSQGMSMDAAVMDLQKTFEFGQGYVALSRVRRLSGLYLLGYNQKTFLIHPAIRCQDQVFRENSQETQIKFAATDKAQIIQKQNNFLRACGGTLSENISEQRAPTRKEKKGATTYEQTLSLVAQGKNIEQVAKERGLTQGTIIGHLENLIFKEKISHEQLQRIIDSKLLLAAPEIIQMFRDLDTDKLQPVFEKFASKYSYNELRLIRLLMLFD